MSGKFKRIVALVSEAMQDELTWRKTWQSQSGLQQNWISKRAYTGTNQITTMISAWKNEYKSPYWLTYKQVQNLGGNVKGQTATPAIFYGTGEDKDTEKKYKFSHVYNLFNIEQTGIKLPAVEVRQTKLKMPLPGQFETDDAHQSTLYHECIHATGHSKRLDRELTGNFGSEDYAKEELVAELGSVFLCAELGVNYDLKQHASYIQSWQKAIESDPNYLLTASSAAKKAAEYCMSQFRMMRQYDDVA